MANLHVSSARATPWFKYVATNLTGDGSFISTTAALTTTRPTEQLIPTRGADGVKFRGIEILPFGTNSADETIVFYLNQVNLITDWGIDGRGDIDFVHSLTNQYFIRPITAITGVQKEQVAPDGAAGAYLGTADFTCDTITQARTTFGTAMESAFGQTSVLNSAAGDILGATYTLPDFGNADFLLLSYDNGNGTSASANALIKLFA